MLSGSGDRARRPRSLPDSPQSRLSKRTTRNPWLTSFSQNSVRQKIICAPSPMINMTAGSPGSPMSS